MPNSAPLFRSMDWAIIKELLPHEISIHLPDDDPVDNKEEIRQTIRRLQTLGPRGKLIVDKYLEGEIDEDEMNKKLDKISEDINVRQYEIYQRKLDNMLSIINVPTWKQIVPFVSSGLDKHQLKEIAVDLHNLNLYQNNNSIGSKKKKQAIKEHAKDLGI